MNDKLWHVLAVPVWVIAGVGTTWTWIGDGRKPATLEDCPPGTQISISYSNSIGDWRRFCYRRRDAK